MDRYAGRTAGAVCGAAKNVVAVQSAGVGVQQESVGEEGAL